MKTAAVRAPSPERVAAAKEVRKVVSGLTIIEREAVAKKARVTIQTMYNIAKPDHVPSMTTLRDVQKALKAVAKK